MYNHVYPWPSHVAFLLPLASRKTQPYLYQGTRETESDFLRSESLEEQAVRKP